MVYRTDWDGSRIAYAWDAARSLYVAGEGAGTRDTLAWDAGNQRWTWTQGGSQLIERYDASKNGRVFESVDRDGNATSYVYNAAGALGEVRTANGEITYLDYDGSGRLSKIRTVTNNGSGAQTSTAVRYGYDGAGRLSTVTLDLSPDDNSIADGKVFTTTYGYDGSSGRIASIAQSDGAKVAFGYQLIDGQYRVVSIAQTSDIGVLRTTTLSYDTANRRTTITDPLGQDTILAYDAQGRLLQTSSPAVNGARQTQFFGYDAAGQVATIRDGLGNEVKYTYDAAGNLIKQEDAVGTVVERTFGSDNQLLSETVSGPNTAAATTRYVYDAEQHLRFTISAEGRVNELRYNAAGQQIAKLSYSEGRYAGGDYSETALAAWAGANARIGERTDSEYDFRGNLSKLTQYGTLAADGSGVIDDKTIQTRYVYDAQGRLLQRYAGPIAAPEVEQFVYDGLGRTIRTTGFNDAVTITQYDDAQRRTVVNFDNGLVRTSSYNHAGELIALAESGSGGTLLSQVRYHYDADGRLRMSEDALGARTHVLYDEAGRRVAEIDAAGALTEYVYDANNQVVKTLAYANAVGAAGLAALLDAEGKPKQTASVNGQTVALTLANSGLRPAADAAADRPQWRFYDAAGRLIKTVGGDGALTEYAYDAGSRLIRMQVHGAAVKMSAFLAAPTLANAVPERTIDSRSVTTRYFYSADGLLVGVQEGANGMNGGGGFTETIYDGAGRKIKTIGYATPTTQSLRMTGTLEQLRPGPNFKDIHTYYNYDSRGLLVFGEEGVRWVRQGVGGDRGGGGDDLYRGRGGGLAGERRNHGHHRGGRDRRDGGRWRGIGRYGCRRRRHHDGRRGRHRRRGRIDREPSRSDRRRRAGQVRLEGRRYERARRRSDRGSRRVERAGKRPRQGRQGGRRFRPRGRFGRGQQRGDQRLGVGAGCGKLQLEERRDLGGELRCGIRGGAGNRSPAVRRRGRLERRAEQRQSATGTGQEIHPRHAQRLCRGCRQRGCARQPFRRSADAGRPGCGRLDHRQQHRGAGGGAAAGVRRCRGS
nr:RHS repeat protein [Lysobacter enzymogenes]